jgi:NADH-quinone oxidoreductase subunit J
LTLFAVTGLAIGASWALYGVGTVFVLAGALGVVLLRNPVHCALSLVTTIFGIALLFVDEHAYFLAAVQIIVYAGAIVILFLFVIMLLGVDRKEARAPENVRFLVPMALVVGAVAVAELLVLARVHYWAAGAKSTTESISGQGTNIQKLGQTIFTSYLLPFEMTAALLVIAVVAAVALVRRRSQPPPAPPRKSAGALRQPARAPESPGPAERAPATAGAVRTAASGTGSPAAAGSRPGPKSSRDTREGRAVS